MITKEQMDRLPKAVQNYIKKLECDVADYYACLYNPNHLLGTW